MEVNGLSEKESNGKTGKMSSDDYYEEGMLLYNKEDYIKAIKYFNRALRLNPENVKAWNSKAYTLYYISAFKRAVKCYNRIIELFPDTPDAIKAWRRKAYIFFLEGKYEEAVISYNKVLEVFPNDTYIKIQREKALNLINKEAHKEEGVAVILKNSAWEIDIATVTEEED